MLVVYLLLLSVVYVCYIAFLLLIVNKVKVVISQHCPLSSDWCGAHLRFQGLELAVMYSRPHLFHNLPLPSRFYTGSHSAYPSRMSWPGWLIRYCEHATRFKLEKIAHPSTSWLNVVELRWPTLYQTSTCWLRLAVICIVQVAFCWQQQTTVVEVWIVLVAAHNLYVANRILIIDKVLKCVCLADNKSGLLADIAALHCSPNWHLCQIPRKFLPSWSRDSCCRV